MTVLAHEAPQAKTRPSAQRARRVWAKLRWSALVGAERRPVVDLIVDLGVVDLDLFEFVVLNLDHDHDHDHDVMVSMPFDSQIARVGAVRRHRTVQRCWHTQPLRTVIHHGSRWPGWSSQ
jgi:hypothetical protein